MTDTWNGGTGDWAGSNWSTGSMPVSPDGAAASSGTVTISSQDFETVGALTFTGSAELLINSGSLEVGDGSPPGAPTLNFTLGSGGAVLNGSYGNLTVGPYINGTASGTVYLEGSGNSLFWEATQASSSSGLTVDFADGGQNGSFNVQGPFSGKVTGFQSGDTITDNYGTGNATYSFGSNNVTVTRGGQQLTIQFSGGTYNSSNVSVDSSGNITTTFTPPAPQVGSSTYDASSGKLVVTAATGAGTAPFTGTIDPTQLTITGEDGYTYTLTGGAVSNESGSSFTVTLTSADQLQVDGLLDNNGTQSTGNDIFNSGQGPTTYQVSATGSFDVGGKASSGGVTVSNALNPTITSATYNPSTGILTLNGTQFEDAGGYGGIYLGQFTLKNSSGGSFTFNSQDFGNASSTTQATIDLSNTTQGTQSIQSGEENSVNTLFQGSGPYTLSATSGWDSGAGGVITNLAISASGSNPTISSATYDAATGALVVAGSNLTTNAGDFSPNALTITGQGGIAYTLTGGTVSGNSSTGFTVTLTSADQLAIDGLLNTNGTASAGATTYNIAATSSFDTGGSASNGGITVSSALTPTISGVAYNAATGVLSLTGTGLENEGATPGLAPADFTLTGKNGATVALSSADTGAITSSTAVTITLTSAQEAAVNAIFDANGTSDASATYNLAATAGWDAAVGAAITTQGVTVSGDPPTVTTSSGSASFVAGDNTASTPVAVDPGLTVSDSSVTTLAKATVAITANFASTDMLSFTNNGATEGNITAAYNGGTGVLTLTSVDASATLAQFQAALDSVTFTDTAVTPPNGTRTISFTATDANNLTSAAATRTMTVTDTDQTPTLVVQSSTTEAVQGGAAVAVAASVTVGDRDNETLASGTVSLGASYKSGDVLAFTNTSSATYGNISANYDGAGTLNLSSQNATATLAQWQAALLAVSYQDTGTDTTTSGHPTRSFSFTVSDGTKTSSAATTTLTIDRPPSVMAETGSVLAGATLTGAAGAALAGDKDADGDVLSINSVTAGATTDAVTSGSPATIAGTYGSLTLNADGSYSYVASNGLAIVTAANGSPIADSFSLGVSDGNGGVTPSSLAVTISLAAGGTETVTNPTGNATYSIGATTLTLNETSASTYGGVIQDGTSGNTGGTVVVAGNAPLTLTGASTYTGPTRISGTLDLSGSGSIAAASKVSLTQAGATLDISGASAAVSINKLGGAVGSVIELGANTLSVNESIASGLGSGAGTFAGVIQDGGSGGGTGGSLAVAGTAALTLTGANTYTGATRVSGTLDLAGAASIHSSSKIALTTAGATLDISGAAAGEVINKLGGIAGTLVDLGSRNLKIKVKTGTVDTFAGTIQDGGVAGGSGGSLTVGGQGGPGELSLTHANNSYTGGTTIAAGTLDIAAVGAAGTGTITFASPANYGVETLDIDAAALTSVTAAQASTTPAVVSVTPVASQYNFANAIAGATSANQVIDLTSLAYVQGSTSATLVGTTLNVSDGASDVTLHLASPQAKSSFTTASDGQGGTLVYDPPATTKHAPATAKIDPSWIEMAMADFGGVTGEGHAHAGMHDPYGPAAASAFEHHHGPLEKAVHGA